ncbi:uncharacterized protein LOC130713679 isoform X3 [Lotus japonicus]|uniref:uncharacterized protein LOC130713679 isoform X3 n=1 Tax=Lotus japonicus TaxID=34305 RepID=UPI00259062D0|nr:uncharacterized protein LOC130713679 isoform X3 [Lotus japonicus]
MLSGSDMRSFWLAKNKSVLDCLLAESSSIVCLHVVTEAASQCSGINKQTQRKRSPKGQLGVKFKPFSKSLWDYVPMSDCLVINHGEFMYSPLCFTVSSMLQEHQFLDQ